jgi:uncharacterized membrane protein YfcA
MQWDIALAGLIVGFVIGLTGMGGGALMTPVLVLLFHVNPGAAISSDVVASVVLKPIGGGVHLRHGTVNFRLVRWLMLGSVPSAFLGAYLISRIVGVNGGNTIKTILGVVLMIAAGAMLAKITIQARRKNGPTGQLLGADAVRPLPTLLIGIFGGLIVGMTSVGSGSLMIVLLMLLYPQLSAREMVGTDLVQAIPLVASAALGHLVFGHASFDTTTSVLVGAIPGVFFGAHISARASDKYIRPVLVAVLTISALKLLNVSNNVLFGVIITSAVIGIGLVAITVVRRRRIAEVPATPTHAQPADMNSDPELAPTAGA